MYQFFLSEKGTLQTVKEVEKALEDKGIKVCKRDIQRDLADMKKAGFLESVGNNQNLKYKLSANQPVPMFEKINVQSLRKIGGGKLSTIIKALNQRKMLKVDDTALAKKTNRKYDTFITKPTGKIKILEPIDLIAHKSTLYISCSEPGESVKWIPLTDFENKIITATEYV